MKNLNRILWGILLVGVGVVLALKALGFEFDILFDGWWTLFIIVPCAVGVFTEHDKVGNLIGLAVGISLLLACRDILSFTVIWQVAVPVAVIVIGLKMIFGGFFQRKVDETKLEKQRSGKDTVVKCAIFSGQDIRCDGEEFHGAKLTAVFGGMEFDLRNAVIADDCVIEVCAVFGGIDIFLPENVGVKISSTSIFGGIENKRAGARSTGSTVYVQGAAVFGGVDLK